MSEQARTKRACTTCTFMDLCIGHGQAAMECRRFPPIVLEPDGEGGGVWLGFPHVREGDWCGEYAPEPTA